MTDQTATSPTARTTGIAPIGDLRMYYEIHGSGGDVPLLLLHGGLFDIDLQFGKLLPGLAGTRRVVAADFQGHGRTNDIDRPLTCANLASDVVALLAHLGIEKADVFGFSVGGGVALHLAIRHPELVHKLVVSSVSFHPDGDRGENADAVAELTVDMIAGTPMEQEYVAKSPHPDRLQGLLDKLARFDEGFPGWTDDDIRGIAAPTLILHGQDDPLVPVSGAHDLARHIRGARLEIIKGMGHDLPPALLPRFVELILAHARGARAEPQRQRA